MSAIEALERRMQGAVKQPEAETGLLSYDQVAARLGKNGQPISRRQVERMVKRYPNQLKRVRLGPRSVRFRQADVDRLISSLAGEKIGGRQL